jgi:hypothetical protein
MLDMASDRALEAALGPVGYGHSFARQPLIGLAFCLHFENFGGGTTYWPYGFRCGLH